MSVSIRRKIDQYGQSTRQKDHVHHRYYLLDSMLSKFCWSHVTSRITRRFNESDGMHVQMTVDGGLFRFSWSAPASGVRISPVTTLPDLEHNVHLSSEVPALQSETWQGADTCRQPMVCTTILIVRFNYFSLNEWPALHSRWAEDR